MASFPSDPISPTQFMEELVPQLMSEGPLAGAEGAPSVKLGVLISGDGGGEWVIHAESGSFEVVAGSREAAAFTIVQSVEDWRGALWEGRGGVFGAQASALFKGQGGGTAAPGTPPNAAAIAQLGGLDGVIEVVVTGGVGGDWSAAFKLGPGAIPEEATTRVSITAEDAEAMQSGELDPMQAFMSGKIEIAGDITLMMQMQAIAMQAALG